MTPETNEIVAAFGRRKLVPRACVVDSKAHIRNFLREALEELEFVACECDGLDRLRATIVDKRPDLIVLGLSAGGFTANATIEELHRLQFSGKILVFGQPSLMATAMIAIGDKLGLTMLPLLPTPFKDTDLRERTDSFRPAEPPPNPPIDVGEAIHADWLELWYQPKVEVRSLTMKGAEALIRLRHPNWGTIEPACFIHDSTDPYYGALAEFVVTRAMQDWRKFVTEVGHLEIAVNLPVSFFEDPHAVEFLAGQIPRHSAFEGLIIEISGRELIRDIALVKQTARRLQMFNIGISVSEIGAEWPLLMEMDEFPFVEIKVDRGFVTQCGDDRLKQSTCRRILELADGFGARTVAVGVESRSDFLTARDLGFDMLQGYFFAKPMEVRKFARRVLGRPVEISD